MQFFKYILYSDFDTTTQPFGRAPSVGHSSSPIFGVSSATSNQRQTPSWQSDAISRPESTQNTVFDPFHVVTTTSSPQIRKDNWNSNNKKLTTKNNNNEKDEYLKTTTTNNSNLTTTGKKSINSNYRIAAKIIINEGRQGRNFFFKNKEK